MYAKELADIAVFNAVAQTGGFRAAADRIGSSPASVSEAIKRLEQHLGVILFLRTTRSIAITQEGRFLLARSAEPLRVLSDASYELRAQAGELTGPLRLSAPRISGAIFLNDYLCRFMEIHPQISVEVVYEDRKVDLVTEPFDAAIRADTMLDDDTYAVPFGPMLDMMVVASPDYLIKRGRPGTWRDIAEHDCVCFTFSATRRPMSWIFEEDTSTYAVEPTPRVVVNDFREVLSFASAGLGLAYVPVRAAQAAIDAGDLLPVLDQTVKRAGQCSINYLTKRNLSARLRAFIQFGRKP